MQDAVGANFKNACLKRDRSVLVELSTIILFGTRRERGNDDQNTTFLVQAVIIVGGGWRS
jgi:hypothetical protein